MRPGTFAIFIGEVDCVDENEMKSFDHAESYYLSCY